MTTTKKSEDAIMQLAIRVRSGEAAALARAITLVENDAEGARGLLAACFAPNESALRIGVTGAPGAGKSTLVDQMVQRYTSEKKSVAVLAVDPTSPFSGGAVLGDRIRMQTKSEDANVFIRSMATRGHLGGLAAAAADACMLMESSGRNPVLIETVGVGQEETAVMRLADITLVVLTPGMGDEVTSLKAGIMEIADIFVINKCDREGAERLEAEILALQSLATEHSERTAPIVRTVASAGEGVENLMAEIARCDAWLRESGTMERRRQTAWKTRLAEMLHAEWLRRLPQRGLGAEEMTQHARGIAAGKTNPYTLAGRLMKAEWLGADTYRLDHLGVAVRSIKEARKFYEVLGLRVVHEEVVEQEQVRVAMLELGEGRIELLEPTTEDSVIGKFLAKRGEGLHHIAVRVPDVDATYARLGAKVRLVREEIGRGAGGHRYFFIHPAATGGVLVEVVGDKNVPEKKA